MLRDKLLIVRNFMHSTGGILYHILVVALSAGIALSLPTVARSFLIQWSRVENDKGLSRRCGNDDGDFSDCLL